MSRNYFLLSRILQAGLCDEYADSIEGRLKKSAYFSFVFGAAWPSGRGEETLNTVYSGYLVLVALLFELDSDQK